MIDTERIREIIDEKLAGTDLFLVGIRQSPSNEIEITIDSDTSVGIDRCAELSRAVEEAFDRDAEDFELTVMSAGIGQPLTMLRQYRKLIGREVEAVLKDGSKLTAVLKDASAEVLTLSYSEKVAVEGKKRRVSVERERTIPLAEIKTTREHLRSHLPLHQDDPRPPAIQVTKRQPARRGPQPDIKHTQKKLK